MDADIKSKINEILKDLNADELDEVIKIASSRKINHEVVELFQQAVEAKYSTGFICPYCGDTHIVKNGRHNNVQQYLCKNCRKTFNWKKGTFLENSNLSLSTWLEYIIVFAQEKTIRECASASNISIPASFNCRHRLMNTIENSKNSNELDGIIELDDTSSVISYSGNHYKRNSDFEGLTRMPYKRSRKGHKHEDVITDEVIISCIVDRHHHAYAKVGKVGTTALSKEDVKEIYGNIIKNKTTVCADGNYAYRILVETNDIELHATANKDRHKRGMYHINNVNNFHSMIDRYLLNHHGIATKYLNEYLAYLCYKYSKKLNDISNLVITLFCNTCTYRLKNYVKTDLLGNLYNYQ